MLNIVVCVSGGGTNLQAIIDGIDAGRITNTKITGVISNNASAYALERERKEKKKWDTCILHFSKGFSEKGRI